MATDTQERPDVDERYATAVNATSLEVVEHHSGAVDVLAAAAWSPTRIGSALLRLHSEFDGGERLRKGPSFQTDAKLLLMRLKTMPALREQVALQALKWGMGKPGDPIDRSERSERRELDAKHLTLLRSELARAATEEDKAVATLRLERVQALVAARDAEDEAEDLARATATAAQVLLWWLDRLCPKCHGRRFQAVPGTPSLSAKTCLPREKGGCGGSGEARLPCGEDGRRLANFLDDCVSRARQSIKQRLRQTR